MSPGTVAARPDRLHRYADRSRAARGQLRASQLTGALDRLRASRSDGPLHVHHVDAELRRVHERLADVDSAVPDTADALTAADAEAWVWTTSTSSAPMRRSTRCAPRADPVSWSEWHGEDPAEPVSGAVRLPTGHQTDGDEVSGHSAYFDAGSDAQQHIALVVTGRWPARSPSPR